MTRTVLLKCPIRFDNFVIVMIMIMIMIMITIIIIIIIITIFYLLMYPLSKIVKMVGRSEK